MNKLLAAAAPLSCLAFVAVGPAAASRDIKVVNRTGNAVRGLFISSVDIDEWEEAVLGACRIVAVSCENYRY